MTRGDEIRRMSNEQLVDNYLCFIRCADCDLLDRCNTYCEEMRAEREDVCRDLWLERLNEEVGND